MMRRISSRDVKYDGILNWGGKVTTLMKRVEGRNERVEGRVKERTYSLNVLPQTLHIVRCVVPINTTLARH